jgi:hypothetical protein
MTPAGTTKPFWLDENSILRGYNRAPQVFYFGRGRNGI